MKSFNNFRQFLGAVLISCAAIGTQAQTTYLCNEKFSAKTPSGWSIQPTFSSTAPSWKTDTGICLSAKYAMHGFVPLTTGDTAELVTPFFDCTKYEHVLVRFSHICKVLPSDICEIQYQEQGLGTYYQWRPIPRDAYLGNCSAYKTELKFSHNSYLEWGSYDTFAKPTSGWYKQETFDISDYASLSTVRFRFIIRKGSYLGSYIAAGWYVDDFQVLGSNSVIRPPAVEFIHSPRDTVYSTGPFAVKAKVATRTSSKIVTPYLSYTTTYEGLTQTDSIRMTAVAGDSIWTATIPQHRYRTNISYSIYARDAAKNSSRESGRCYLKHSGHSTTTLDSLQYGTSYASGASSTPLNTSGGGYNWSKVLYTAQMIDPKRNGRSISGIAFYTPNAPGILPGYTRHDRIYMKATSLPTLKGSNVTVIDPANEGAILVFDGEYVSTQGWTRISFDRTFYLNPGENLLIYRLDTGDNACNSTLQFYSYNSVNYAAQEYYYTSLSCIATASAYSTLFYVPTTRFLFGKNNEYDSNSVAMASIDHPAKGTVAGRQPVRITLQNKGEKDLRSAKVHWMVNGVIQPTKTYTGNLPCDFSDTLTLGFYTQKLNGHDTITVWVNTPNNAYDSYTRDDSLRTIAYGCDSLMHGSYSIGKNDNTHRYDFASIGDALKRMNNCGINGDINLKLASGIYSDTLDYSNFSGMDGYTLILSSLAENADSVIFRPKSGNVLTLGNTRNIVFRNITFDADHSAHSHCVYLGSGCRNVEFRHCTLLGWLGSQNNSDAYSTVYKPVGNIVEDIRFIGNRILGGSYGVCLNGNSIAVKNRRIVFDSNWISRSYSYPFYGYYNQLAFSHNLLEESSETCDTYHGVYNCYIDSSLFDGNRIVTYSYATNQYGLYICNADSSTLVCNNEIIMKGNNGMSIGYGMYFLFPNGTKAVNNSLLLNGSMQHYGICVNIGSSGFGMTLQNNLCVANGKNANYPLYVTSTQYLNDFHTDYNCWWSSNGTVSYAGGALGSLAAHRNVFPTAVHDIFFYPAFADTAKDLNLENTFGLNCPAFRDVTHDIKGTPRIAFTAMGAYSELLPRVNAALFTLLDWPGFSDVKDTLCPRAVLMNKGAQTLTDATLRVSINQTVQGKDIIWKGKLASGACDTVSLGCFRPKSGNNLLKVWLTGLGSQKDSIPEDDSLSAHTYTCGGMLSGSYTVGKKGYFSCMTEAAGALKACGLNGPVTLQLLPDTLMENVVLGYIPGLSSSNTLTICSSTGDSSSVLWMRADNASHNALSESSAPLVLDSISHVRIHGITLSGVAPKTTDTYRYSHGIAVCGNSSDIEIRNCGLCVPTDFTSAQTGTRHNAVFLSGSVRDIRIHHNRVKGGAEGFCLCGDSTRRISFIRIEHNTIESVDFSAIYCKHVDSLDFKGNTARQRKGDFAAANAQVVYADSTNANFTGNVFSFESIYYGLYVNNFGSASYCRFVNNEMRGTLGDNTGFGIYFGKDVQLDLYHNSFAFDVRSANCYGLYLQTTVKRLNIRNNIFCMLSQKQNAYPLFISKSTYLNNVDIDNNCYYNAYPQTPYIGYAEGAKITLQDWKTAVSGDKGSVSLLPHFTNMDRSLALMDSTGIACPSIPGITDDLLNCSRDSLKTNMGAYQFSPRKLDLAVTALISPSEWETTGKSVPLTVRLTNVGTDSVTSASISYTLNGVSGSTFQWKGRLGFLDTASVTVGNIKAGSGFNTLNAYCFNPNGNKDERPDNDSLNAGFIGCDSVLSGSYSVGGPHANYRNLSEAVNALKRCGMDGPIVLNVASGSYGPVNMDDFNIGSRQYSLTIRSAAGKRDSVVFEDPYACRLKDVSHVTFEDVSFKGSVTAVEMSGYLENVEFRHCNIYGRTGTADNSCRTVSYANSANVSDFLNDVRFIGNDIRGGYYNMYLTYPAGALGNLKKGGMILDSNSFSEAYAYGIYNYYNSHIQSFSHNTITNGSHAESYYAYYGYSYSNIGRITGNRVHLNNNNSGYGFYFNTNQNASGYSSQVATFANNEVILTGSGIKYGVHFLSYNGKWNVCNNSIYVNGTGNGTCLYNSNLTSGGVINMYNNVLVMGIANGYPLYISTSGCITPDFGERDYNNYVNLTGNNLAFLGSAKTDLTAIRQTNALQDQHSLSALPVWKEASMRMLQYANTQAFTCPVMDSVKDDIDGRPRPGLLTCMGCYGIEPDSIDAGLLDFVGAEEALAAANQPISVVLSNAGRTPLDTATISLYINGNLMARKGYKAPKPLAYDEKDTVLMGHFNFHMGQYTFLAYVDKDGDSDRDNDTVILSRQICSSSFSGKVVIGNSARAAYRISQLDTLWNDMEACGVGGDVTLAFESGKYSLASSVDLSILLRIMNGYRLTITSEAGNRDSVYITGKAANMFDLRNNSRITIRDLSLENQSGNIIYFSGPCRNIDILYNNLNSSAITSVSDINPIQKPIKTGVADSIRIIGNRINGGYHNIYIYGENTSSYNHHIVIDSNVCTNAYGYGIFVYDNDIISLSRNRISCRTSNSSPSYYGLYSFQCNYENMLSNDIDVSVGTNVNSSYPVYMSFTNSNGTSKQALIANNVIKGQSTGTYSGFYTSTGRIRFCHNSVYMGGSGAVRALYSNSTAAYPAEFIGNQLVTAASGFPLYSASSIVGSAKFDYNNYYSGGTNIAYYGRNIANVATLRTYTGGDQHSVSVAVQFTDLSKSQRLADYIGMTMPRQNGIGTDCENTPREAMTGMGAYEPLTQKLDAALTDFGKTVISVSGKTLAEVTLFNYGKDTLISADIEWSINGVAQKTVLWNGSLPMFSSTVIRLDSIQAVAGKMFYLSAWVSRPNKGTDMNHANDTVSISEYACNGTLGGTYYVGGNNADFATLKDAMDAIYTCGVGNPVTLKVRSGRYDAMEIKGKVYGADKYNTITVMADGNAQVIVDGGSFKPAITLNDASFWSFRNITFGNTAGGTIGVQFRQTNKEIHFHGCSICASTSATSSSFRCIDYSNTENSSYCLNNVTFIRNTLRGGYYNIYLYCMGSDKGNLPLCSITLDSNTLSDATYCGIYSYYWAHFKSISHNSITNRRNSGTFYGIYAYYNQNIDRMEGNRIHIDNSSDAYGIYLANHINDAANSGIAGKMTNNEVTVNGTGSNKYGIYFYQPYQSWEISHNSVLITSTTAAVYGLYCNNPSQTYLTTIKNNLFTTSGTNTNYPIHLASYGNSLHVTMDYNNYWALNSGVPSATIGYASTLINSLATWKSNTGEDAHSTNLQPSYADSTLDLSLKDYRPFVCPKLGSVNTDINGKTRTSVTSMGAHGADIYNDVNLKVVEFVNPKPIDNVVCYADYTPLSIAITNNGLKEADFSKSALKISVDVSGAATFHSDTVFTAGKLQYLQLDTLALGSIPTMASGTYRIKVTLNHTDDKVPGDDTLTLFHQAYRVELPYDIDFSSTPAEFVNSNMNGETAWKVVKGSGSNPALAPAFGSGRLEFAGAGAPGNSANAIFNAVNIHDCLNPTLSFWYAHNAACSASDMLIVLLTTDGGATYTEVQRILATDTVTAWKQYDIDLTPFNRYSCLSIIFRAVSFGGSDQSIDRIRIRSDKDASLELLPIDISQRTACDNTPVDVRAVLTNRTLMSMDLQQDTIRLNVTGAVSQSSIYVYNRKLGGHERDTIILGQLDLSANGNFYIEAFMQSFDDNTSNDTVHDSTLYIMQDMALDSIIGMDEQTFRIAGEKVGISTVAVNRGNVTADRVLFRMNLDGNEVVTDTVFTPMKPGDTLIHAMSKPYTVPGVSKDQPFYFLEVRVELDCDGFGSNDSISLVCNVMIPDSIDIQVLDITATSPAKGKTKVAPTVRVANIGNQEADNIVLHVDVIDSSMKVVESISENINHMAVNETKNVAFTMNYTVPNYTGKYTLRAYVEAVSGDTIQRNDTLNKQFDNTVDDTRISESEGLNWSLGQNIPNPAAGITRIPFSLPQGGEAVFSVMGTNGQQIYRETIRTEAGQHSVEFNVSDLAAGIYYYSMEYNGQRIVRKMSVVR